ncbi:glyoxalase superfamily protein [Altererythrobacter ishigakiensis]|uniref:Glyoxalase-related protein domain-containing protein n=1 Tax=Altererythrobacter ishigakiensis TaxID=476157 RepID=A0A562UXM5_9SPHN|nr:glyoxalase superfamily protein [Altererythrobacter ishigakiensis]TWJ10357.1 hypothetical protein JN10_2021 [Altererythrobacter ishigakiensis]
MYSKHLPNLANMKALVRRYRSIKQAQGRQVSHSRALELIARRYGFFDWNTAAAQARNLHAPDRFQAGQHVSGRYMGHEFQGRVVASTLLSQEEVLISLEFWEPVDVVTSKHFSNKRTRVSVKIGIDGRSQECLSGGIPHLEVVEELKMARP